MGLRKVETKRSAAYGSYGSGSSNSISGVASVETGCHVHWIGLQWRGSQSLCLGNGCRVIHFPLFLFTTTNTRGGSASRDYSPMVRTSGTGSPNSCGNTPLWAGFRGRSSERASAPCCTGRRCAAASPARSCGECRLSTN